MKKKDIKNESVNVKNRKQTFEKMPPTYGAFYQHVKRAHLQSLIFYKAEKAVIEMKHPEHFGWKSDGTCYIAIVTDNLMAPDTVISFVSCNFKGNIFLLEFVRRLFDYLDNHIFR